MGGSYNSPWREGCRQRDLPGSWSRVQEWDEGLGEPESVFIAESGWGRESWRLYPSAHSRLSGELRAMGVGPWRVPTLGPEDIPCFLSTIQDQPKDRDLSPARLCPRSQ